MPSPEVRGSQTQDPPPSQGIVTPPQDSPPSQPSAAREPKPKPTMQQLQEMRKVIDDLKSQIISLKRPSESEPILSFDATCKFCSLQVQSHRYCPISGLRHVSSDVCEFYINNARQQFPFPKEILDDDLEILSVLFLNSFTDIIGTPSMVKEESKNWLKATYCACLVPGQDMTMCMRQEYKPVPLGSLEQYIPKI
eukprot:TRINITY_DN2199_c1_g1_i4.p1 TRINITY_DN2199_c1_g1~~TRINITY_DN2199_c1_g1_i4.p1  ORF type:complete len:195 (+),score=13.10 TRINITY_DN2199_c1_g1_i4:277-861(+)